MFNAYVIAFGGLLLLGGRLSDLLGARKVFMVGWSVLIAGSVLAAAATTAWVEVAGRAVQGVGGTLIAPASMTLLMMLFGYDPKELGKALALYGAAAPAGGTAGVFLGGVFTEWASWPWVFIVYVPIGIATLLATGFLPAVSARRGGGVDVLGAAAVTVGLALTVFAVVRAPEAGWTSAATLVELFSGLVLLTVFVLIQRVSRAPLMPLGIWRTPGLGVSNLAMALLGAAWIPMWYFLNLYLQQALGYGAFASGAALLPMTGLLMLLMTSHIEAAQDRAASGVEQHQAVLPRLVQPYSEAQVETAGEIGLDGCAGLDVKGGGQATWRILLLPPEWQVEGASDLAPEDFFRQGVDHHLVRAHPSPSASR